MKEYDRIAAWFAAARSTEAGLPDLARFADALPRGARVLDVGCGTGMPIAGYLVARGFRLFAIDSSASMLELFRANFPDVPAQCGTIQESDLFGETFDGAVGWGVLFHLPPGDQRLAVAKLARHLVPGGRLLFTAGETEGETSGVMNGVTFRYYALGSAAYRRLLDENGMDLVNEHEDAWENHVYVAVKRGRLPILESES